MTPLEIRDSLQGYWAENYKTTPTLYDNVPLPDALKAIPFVTFEIDLIDSHTVGAGTDEGTFTRYIGMIAITVNVPRDSGSRKAYEIATEAISLLERRRIDGLFTRAGRIDKDLYDKEYFSLVTIIPFKTSVG